MTHPDDKNDSTGILVRSVADLRAKAAGILIAAQMGQTTTIHPRIGTLEQRLEYIIKTAQEIMDAAREFYPNKPIKNPIPKLTYLTEIP